jgi:hypothetical protein
MFLSLLSRLAKFTLTVCTAQSLLLLLVRFLLRLGLRLCQFNIDRYDFG